MPSKIVDIKVAASSGMPVDDSEMAMDDYAWGVLRRGGQLCRIYTVIYEKNHVILTHVDVVWWLYLV